MTTYKMGIVQKGIPIPTAKKDRNLEMYQKVASMSIGDCIDIPYSRTGVASSQGR